ncbi:hypothetical protein [Photobacterium leiognathi]|uniref:hypothetical protein n=1 Tax=Photobacterium leiognathi TaxID=553611 RepID=UPI002982914C|nr:hypothetical protein [Photobacterium leiognathi]
MFASIQSEQFCDFYCRINENPVHTYKNILVYELVDSAFPNDIIKKVNGEVVGKFKHIALDTNGNGYLFDFINKTLAGSVGKCEYTADR